MGREKPLDKIPHIPLDKVKEIMDKVNLERQVSNEITGDNWKVKITEMKTRKDNNEFEYKLYGIYLGDKSVAVSITNDGKLKHVILNDIKLLDETDQTVRKRATMLLLDYEKHRVVVEESEMELWKGKTGFESIKSISIIKSEVRDLQ
ncbi:hypothetical protein [Sulfurisphaera ohwakuensis]|uniref:Uncharacterized protein n=1 Tax=Sulfurisphaera ohwakuensis TaxID=69656 RepID=A0A650CHX6_SULOH|nr:hypothetical protein [Sulfurisphaera ohwakuensis]MBB5255243.1 hypothetical protein [Sulfurisphaera ohwakuensis]QGR17454.1 hypothetical protein D1869_09800 [Sulfurisphaera ohwakuensis]